MDFDYDETNVLRAGKRLGLNWAPICGDWFISFSPRNENTNAEGPWHHWANLAAMILAHPFTKKVAPDLYRPDLKPDTTMYTACNHLGEEEIDELKKLAASDT